MSKAVSVINYNQRMESFARTLKSMSEAFKGSKYSAFFEFKIIRSENDVFTLGTSSNVNKNYFMQFDMELNGSGQANAFSINIAYVPKPGDDPNFIDKALDGVTLNNNPIYLRFGYSGVTAYNLISDWYECILTGYSLSMRDNYFYYTINGVSSLTSFREKRWNFTATRELENPLWLVEKSIYDKLGRDNVTVIFDEENMNSHVEHQAFAAMNDVTVFEYIGTILSTLKDKDDPKAIYWYDVSDYNYMYKTITIHRTSLKSYQHLSVDNQDVYVDPRILSLVFDWGGNSSNYNRNHLILSFETQYKGEVNIATATEQVVEKRYALRADGTVVTFESPKDILVGDYVEQDLTALNREWTKAVNWTYEASLEMLGIPNDVPIGAIVEINPIVYTRKHHTAGYYMITGAKTFLNESGFRTTLNLIKYTDNANFEVKQYVYDANGYDANRAKDYAIQGQQSMIAKQQYEQEAIARAQESKLDKQKKVTNILWGHTTVGEAKSGPTGQAYEVYNLPVTRNTATTTKQTDNPVN